MIEVVRMPKSRVRVMVVDDHEVVRAGLASLVRKEPDLDLVGTASSGEEALALAENLVPDVVVLDYQLPGMSGAECCERLLRRHPEIAVTILTGFAGDDAILACLKAGAQGIITKDQATADVARVVRELASGQAVLGPAVTRRVMVWVRRAGDLIRGGDLLAPRELEILRYVAQGHSNRTIGERMCLSEATVKLHLSYAMRKLGTRRRYETVAAGIERGVI